jgi:hypothetical protein
MATREDIYAAMRNADKAGDSASVRKLGAYLQSLPAPVQEASAEDRALYDPTNGMSTSDRFLAGAGKAFKDLGRGVGQMGRAVLPTAAGDALGLPTDQDIDEVKRLDAPLMATTAGTVGNVVGDVAAALPAAFLPGGATLPGAALMGTAMGAAQPTGTGDSRLKNAAIGGAAGAGGVLAGRGIAAGVKGAKALAEPFTEGGRQAIAGRTLERFGVNAGDVAGATNAPTLTGARQTLADQISNPAAATGAARLQDSLRALDPEIAGQFATRDIENNAARVGTLQELAGEGGKRESNLWNRATAGKYNYDKAFAQSLPLDEAGQGEVTKLLNVPAIKDAMGAAREIAANKGLDLASPEGSVEGLHLMKLAMDDAISNAGSSAVSVNKAKSIEMAQKRLINVLEQISPDYQTARTTYAALSRPVNQNDVAAELLKRGTAPTTDLSGVPRIMPNALANAARDEGRLITQATGRDLPQKTLADLMEPGQLAKLQAVLGESDRSAAVARAANGPGSATAQRLASQNVLRQILGPTGLPESWAESTLLNTAMRPVQFAYNGVAEPKIQAVLSDLILNPEKARAALLASRTAPQSLPKPVRDALPYLEQMVKASTPAAALAAQR